MHEQSFANHLRVMLGWIGKLRQLLAQLNPLRIRDLCGLTGSASTALAGVRAARWSFRSLLT